LFLKPADESYYWELYVTPAGKKTAFFYPSRSYVGRPGCLDNYCCKLTVAANREEKLNRWTAEIAMPIKDLQAFGKDFKPGIHWKVFVGRYNYSCDLHELELSMTPQLSKTNYHLYEEYADLELVR
jgi:hypothetical protein